MPKTLNLTHPLYNNITRALTADTRSSKLLALKGGLDTAAQPKTLALTDLTPYTFTAQQGIDRDATHWYAFSSSKLEKYDLTNTLITQNLTPYSGLPAGLTHIGDGFIDDTFIYVGMSDYNAGVTTKKVLAIFNKSDLLLNSFVDTFAMDANIGSAGVCLSKDGTEILLVNFSQDGASPLKNKYIHRLDFTTKAYKGTYLLSEQILGMQGIAYSATDDVYYISYHPTSTLTDGRIAAVDPATFEVLNRYDPISMSTEMEGVCHYNGVNYTHVLDGPPRTFEAHSVFLSKLATDGDPIQVIDQSLIANSGTLLLKVKPLSLFNYNSIFDNSQYSNDWEAWIYNTGELAWRVSSSARTSYLSLSNRTEYILAFTWDNVAGTVTAKLAVDGVYQSSITAPWVTPPTGGLWLGGVNGLNNQGNHIYRDLLLFDKVLSDAELLDAYNNFNNLYDLGVAPPSNITGSQSTSYDLSNSITNGLSTSYDLYGSLLQGISTSYDVSSSITNSLSTSYNLSSSLVGQTSTNYDLSLSIYNSHSTSYDLYGSLLQGISTSYDVSSSITNGLSTSYDLSSSLVVGQVTSYDVGNVSLNITGSVSTSYDLYGSTSASISTSMDLYGFISTGQVVSYDLYGSLIESIPTTYDLYSSKKVSQSVSYDLGDISAIERLVVKKAFVLQNSVKSFPIANGRKTFNFI